MLKAFFTIAAIAAIILAVQARADEWTPRLSCDGATLVVDGLHSYEHGFTAHQLVIRDPAVITHFSGLIGAKLETNERGELIRDLGTSEFGGEFAVTLIDVAPPGGGSGVLYSAHGHWLGGGQYEVYVTSLSHYPGMTYHEPTYVGKWVFSHCN